MDRVNVKRLKDDYGVLKDAFSIVPKELHTELIKSLAELENNECHRKREFQHTRLHKVSGTKLSVYRADIDKISGFRLHTQYLEEYICLCDVIEGRLHDNVIEIIKQKKERYR